jgi:hypothetical protein
MECEMALKDDIAEIKAALIGGPLFPGLNAEGWGPLVKDYHVTSNLLMPVTPSSRNLYFQLDIAAVDDWCFNYRFRSPEGYVSRPFFARLGDPPRRKEDAT